MKRIFAVVFLMVGLAVLQACNNDDCSVDRRPYFDIRGFSVTNALRADTLPEFHNSYQTLYDSVLAVPANRFGIALRANILFYTEAVLPVSSFGAAFACTPSNPGHQGSQEIISDIRITSNADFDAAHPAGTSLNEYFLVSAYGSYYYPPNDSLVSMAIPLSDFLNSQPRARIGLELWLTQRPEASLEHRFTVSYHQTNGEHYLVRAPKVTFH